MDEVTLKGLESIADKVQSTSRSERDSVIDAWEAFREKVPGPVGDFRNADRTMRLAGRALLRIRRETRTGETAGLRERVAVLAATELALFGSRLCEELTAEEGELPVPPHGSETKRQDFTPESGTPPSLRDILDLALDDMHGRTGPERDAIVRLISVLARLVTTVVGPR